MLWSPLAVVAAYILGATVVNLEMLACGDRQLTQGFYRATNNREDQQASSLSWVGWVVPSMEGPWGLSSLLDMAPSLMSVMFADVLGRNVEWMFGDLIGRVPARPPLLLVMHVLWIGYDKHVHQPAVQQLMSVELGGEGSATLFDSSLEMVQHGQYALVCLCFCSLILVATDLPGEAEMTRMIVAIGRREKGLGVGPAAQRNVGGLDRSDMESTLDR